MSVIEVKNLSKFFDSQAGRTVALDNINFHVESGDFIGLIGKSGSGKTTLINMLSGIDRPSEGSVRVNRNYLESMNENELSIWRGKEIGIVFQFFQLLPVLTILENVLLPIDYLNETPTNNRIDQAMAILERLNLQDKADKLPYELSGGQQQIAAIARALANDPPILIADEPTGNLDSVTAAQVVALFETLVESKKTILMVTHDQDLVNRTNRILRIRDGQLTEDRNEF